MVTYSYHRLVIISFLITTGKSGSDGQVQAITSREPSSGQQGNGDVVMNHIV